MAEPREEVWSDASAVDMDATADTSPDGLSYVADAARDTLNEKHGMYWRIAWNVSYGKVVGEVLQTPPKDYFLSDQINDDQAETHSDYLPDKFGEIIARAEEWVDFTSLGAPDGKFLDAMAKGLKDLSDTGRPVVVRILTGNIVGMPTDNDALAKALCKHPDYALPDDTNLKIWVGAWRKGTSWNHSKIVAVDGKYLLTGGHNVWDPHYLQKNPVRDLTMEAEGVVAEDGHAFANRMWEWIEKKEREYSEFLRAPDWVPMLYHSRTGICQWPKSVDPYPPQYERKAEIVPLPEAIEAGDIAMVTCGRFGALHHDKSTANPSDSAIVAMMKAAKTSIKLSLQDLGPLAIPLGDRARALPGCVWPEDYLRELGLAIYERGVDVHIVLSHPYSIPSDLGATEANYGNGWTCNDVAAMLIRSIKENVPDADEERLGGLVGLNLKLAYLRTSKGSCDWEDKDGKCGNHAKFFIVDDICYYIGSQNLYIANLAEWGIIIDSAVQTQKILEEYWNPMWAAAYENVPEEERDCNIDEILGSLDVNRNDTLEDLSPEEQEAALLAKKAAKAGGSKNKLAVWLKRATNLRDADGLGSGSSDAYVVIRVVDSDGKDVSPPQTSKVINDCGGEPTWNETMFFEGLEKPCSCTLKINVLDRDSLFGLQFEAADWLAKDDELGCGTVDLGTIDCTERFQDMEVMIADGWFKDSSVFIALDTYGGWGN
eukprot:CAMPEP_0176048494 /NCGR_PEP_ID=MMETSP0120_2-20121206/24090_1 /TAXON_ID=160619 /ORGANISM="Kryptoperidinium foliaceum, Strain CCMP 1326" /LENGTH=712 /DNA_ID=CAMNT_0017381913 /DNA_START=76 /DNA_END=2214 /DNA_ORIENTATION=-